MHQPIRDNLEEYLKGSAQQIPQEFHRAPRSVRGMRERAAPVLKDRRKYCDRLQPDGDLDPRAGFYARVMDKIEQEDGAPSGRYYCSRISDSGWPWRPPFW